MSTSLTSKEIWKERSDRASEASQEGQGRKSSRRLGSISGRLNLVLGGRLWIRHTSGREGELLAGKSSINSLAIYLFSMCGGEREIK